MKNETIVCVCGDESRAAYLIKGKKNLLFDAGMAYSAPAMIQNIRKELGPRPLDAVLLSHSHYDHISGLPFLRKEWPKLLAYGSAYAKNIMEKPSARAVMRDLSERAARGAGLSQAPEYDEEDLRIDRIVRQDDVLCFGDHKIKVYETPGHTKCSLSFLLDDEVIFASETVGVTTRTGYMPTYLVGYQMALDSLEKLKHCGAKRVFLTHVGILKEPPEEVWPYLEEQLKKTKDEIITIINTFPTEEARIQAMTEAYHRGVTEEEQPVAAFRLNAAATLKVVGMECMEENA